MTVTNNGNLEKLLNYIVEDKLYENYKKYLHNKSDSRRKFLVTEDGWAKYKKEHHPLANTSEDM